MNSSCLSSVLSAIDAANAADPRATPEGKPWEVAHAEHLTRWVLRLHPQANALLQIAARGQHLERWINPRASYPEGRAGYLQWREDLKTFHARRTGEVMIQAGCSLAERDRVTALITKKALRAGDPEGQVLEDALCLVFLETQFSALRTKTPESKMTEILRKTWNKMSPAGRAAAQSLPLSVQEKASLVQAFSEGPEAPPQ
ncbi:MAG: DUF4202 domain-containing protein [Elusimicrobia bacterium]|nr:DUF4202 domain-containing protein [Elusimicrobiota bacterium]